MSNYRIYGKVVDDSGTPLTDARVELSVPSSNEQAGPHSQDVDSDGNYDFTFMSTAGQKVYLGGNPSDWIDPTTMNLSVYDASDQLIGQYSESVAWDDFYLGHRIDLTATPQDDDDPNNDDDPNDDADPCLTRECDGFFVFGTLHTGAGSPLNEHTIVLEQVEFREITELARGETDSFGRFRFQYLNEINCHPLGPKVPVRVRALDQSETELLVGATIYRPAREQEFTLVFGTGRGALATEFERLGASFEPFAEGVDLQALNANQHEACDAIYFASQTSLEFNDVDNYLNALRQAARWRESSGTSPSSEIPAEAFFAWIRAGLGNSMERLADRPPADLTHVLERAVADGLIPCLAPLTAEGLAHRIRDFLQLPQLLVVNSFLSDLFNLGAFGPGAGQPEREDFLRRYQQFEGTSSGFWSDYRAHVTGGSLDVDVDRLQLSLSLSELTGQHIPAISRALDAIDAGTVSNLAELAGYEQQAWKDLFMGHPPSTPAIVAPEEYPGATEEARLELFSKAVERAFERRFPLHSLALRLAEGAASEPFVDVTKGEVRDVVLAYPDLVLDRQDLDAYFANPSRNITADELEALKVLQRLHAVIRTPNRHRIIAALEAERIHSAHQIVEYSESELYKAFSSVFENQVEARAVHYRSEIVVSNVRELIMRQHTALVSEGMGITRSPSSNNAPGQESDLDEFLGSLDYCACSQCESVLGPAAYYVELLRTLNREGRQGLGWIYRSGGDPQIPRYRPRRADLQFIDLNCANATTALPHIDIVNELLEDATVLSNRAVQGHVDLPDTDAWDGRWKLRQTTRTEKELAATPEHINYEAYEILRTIDAQGPSQPYLPALKPWTLPFDLFLAESRIYLEQLGSSRGRLLEAIRPQEPLLALDESLNMSGADRELVLDRTPPITVGTRPYVAWYGAGTESPDAGDFDGVRSLMEASGLEFLEVIELLDTWWVGAMQDPDRRLELVQEDECSLADASFEQKSDGASLGFDRMARIHRFVRLWRKLSGALSMDELDECVQKLVPGFAEITDGWLHQIDGLLELVSRFPALSVAELLSWWGDIESRPEKVRLRRGMVESRPTFYEELTSPLLGTDLAPRFVAEESATTGELEIVGPGLVSNEEAERVMASVLGADLEDVKYVTENTVMPLDGPGGSIVVDFRSLSLVHTRISLARALGLSVRRLVDLEGALGIPLAKRIGSAWARNTGDVLELVRNIDLATAVGLDTHDTVFVGLGDKQPELEGVPGAADTLRQVLTLIDLVLTVGAEMPSSADEMRPPESSVVGLEKELTRLQQEGLLVPSEGEVIDKLMAIIHSDPDAFGGSAGLFHLLSAGQFRRFS